MDIDYGYNEDLKIDNKIKIRILIEKLDKEMKEIGNNEWSISRRIIVRIKKLR